MRSKHRTSRRLCLETLDARRVLAVVMGDFNSDGYDDMATGIPHEDVAGFTDAGSVSVIYGSSTGLNPAGDQFWNQDSPGLSGGAESQDEFGSAVAVGDFNADGIDDLVIGVPGEDIGTIVDAGAVQILYGSVNGLVADNFLVHQDSLNMNEVVEEFDRFGETLTSGDYDGDGFDDVAIGVPYENVIDVNGVNQEDSGVVHILFGSKDGVTVSGNQLIAQGMGGMSDFSERYDFYGASLASGSFDNDNFEDLVIGAPGEDNNSKNLFDVGAITLLLGQPKGSTTPSSTTLWQDTNQIPGANENWDHFGASLAVGNFDGDAFDDLAIGSPGEDLEGAHDAGVVTVMYGSSSNSTFDLGLTQLWTKESASGLGFNSVESYFGEALSAGDLNGDGRDDLVIGVPGHAFGSGSINVMYGQNSGLSSYQGRSYFQGNNGIFGSFEDNDWFGAALAVGDTDGDGYDDVAVGVPGENFEGIINAGVVQVVPGRKDYGLDTDSDVIWHQDSPAIQDLNEGDDYFSGERPESLFTSIPKYQSKPGAPINLYLDFNGGTFGDAFGSAYTPEFTLDSRDGLNRTERSLVQDIWAVAAEDFAPFNINVTTVYPSSGTVYRVVIGGDGTERQSNPTSGWAPWAGWGDTNVYVYSDRIQSWNNAGADLALQIGTTVSHEAGHRFGLGHKSTNNNGMVTEYSEGGASWTPIMGNNVATDRTIWTEPQIWFGNTIVIQGSDDFLTLQNQLGLRSDDNFGDGLTWLPGAEQLGSPTSGMLTQEGLIRHTSDEDTYQFDATSAGTYDISLKVADVGANLDSTLMLRDSDGNVLVMTSPVDSLDSTINMKLDAGSYYVTVGSQAMYDGDVGRYTLRIQDTDVPTLLIPLVFDWVESNQRGTGDAEIRETGDSEIRESSESGQRGVTHDHDHNHDHVSPDQLVADSPAFRPVAHSSSRSVHDDLDFSADAEHAEAADNVFGEWPSFAWRPPMQSVNASTTSRSHSAAKRNEVTSDLSPIDDWFAQYELIA